MDPRPEQAHDRRAELGRIIALTRSMLEKAQTGEWTEVQKMESERRQRIRVFFSAGVPEKDSGWVAQAIQEVLEIDGRITTLGQQGLEHISTKITDLQTGRQAQRAYSDCSR